jgi:hypothetical protein
MSGSTAMIWTICAANFPTTITPPITKGSNEMKEVTMYQADNGDVFAEKEEANARDIELQNATGVEQYLAEQGDLKASTKTRTRNAILDFLAWQKETEA